MNIKSTRLKAEKVIAEINMQDHTQMPIDKFLALEQLISELSKDEIDFSKLPKYGCPSDFISCVFACKGIKPNATPTMCATCWKDALTENIYIDPSALENKVEEEEEYVYDDEDVNDIDDYSAALGISPSSGANYFATAAESIKEQFSQQTNEKKKKKSLFNRYKKDFNKNETSKNTNTSEYEVLKKLKLTPEQILKVFDLLEWDTIKDFELLCDILQK